MSPRTHVVTGAASGIGRATGDLLRAQGHRVIGVDRVDAEICVDLATPEGRAELVDAVNHLTGGAIALNAVAPGIVRTPMTAGLLAHPRLSEALQEAIPMPLGGIAEPGDVAELLAFLTSDACRATTGQTIFVDGGSDCVTRGDDVFGG